MATNEPFNPDSVTVERAEERDFNTKNPVIFYRGKFAVTAMRESQHVMSLRFAIRDVMASPVMIDKVAEQVAEACRHAMGEMVEKWNADE
jgi:hypothetical protein